MSNIKKIWSLYIEVITSPEKAFSRIRDEKPFLPGGIILFLIYALSFYFLYLLPDFLEHYLATSGVFALVLDFLTGIVGIFVIVFFIDFVARKIYKIENKYFSFLACYLFTFIPFLIIMVFGLIVTVIGIDQTGIVDYGFLILLVLLLFGIWKIGLDIRAIKVVYGLPKVKTAITYIFGMILFHFARTLWSWFWELL